MRGRALVAFAAAVGLTTACESTTEAKITYTASLNGANEKPSAVTTTGTGTFTGTLDANNVLTYNITFSGLTSNATAAHIHGPADATQAVGVLVNFDASSAGRTIVLGGTSGTATGTIALTAATTITSTVTGDSLRKLLDAGKAYVNVHTVTNGGGEIRGQITRQ